MKVTVPGSTSNLGAGFDCLGIAVNLHLEVELVDGDGLPEYAGTLEGLSPADDLIYGILKVANLLAGKTFRARSAIPLRRGLGSSGAAVVAAHALVQANKHGEIDLEGVYALAQQVEGHRDNVAPSVFGQAVLTTPVPTFIRVSDRLTMAFAIPSQPIETVEARRILPESVLRQTAIDQAASCAALIKGLEGGIPNLITCGMEDRLAVPYRKGLIEGFDAAMAAAREAGAYGATISGSGSTLVAITECGAGEKAAEAMARALGDAGNPAEPFVSDVSQCGVEIVY